MEEVLKSIKLLKYDEGGFHFITFAMIEQLEQIAFSLLLLMSLAQLFEVLSFADHFMNLQQLFFQPHNHFLSVYGLIIHLFTKEHGFLDELGDQVTKITFSS